MNRKVIKALAEEYLEGGGSQRLLDSILISGYSLANEAKLRYALSTLKAKPLPPPTTERKSTDVDKNSSSDEKGIFKDLISTYPVELHPTYLEGKHAFLKACSLKMQLNNMDASQEDEAYALQKEIMKCFEVVDVSYEKLEWWKKHKRILDNSSVEDIDDCSPVELIEKRNRLRSNVSNRSNTILRIEERLKSLPKDKRLKEEDKLLRKREELITLRKLLEILDKRVKMSKYNIK